MAEMSYVYAGTVRSAAGGSGGIFRQTAGDEHWEAERPFAHFMTG